ncbi:hypothetical protein AAVH_09835 [Aphelenchoides avenae]|nr:hypothetical protein AAVH_09835 [Aphelenchus avenae]
MPTAVFKHGPSYSRDVDDDTDEIAFLYSLTKLSDRTTQISLVGDMKPDEKILTKRCGLEQDRYMDEEEWEHITVEFANPHAKCTMVIQVLSENARLEKAVFRPRSQSCYPEEPGRVYRSGNVAVLDITRIDLSAGKKEVTLAVNRNESLSFIVYIRPNDTLCSLNETRVLLSSGDCAFASNATRSNYALRHVQRVIEEGCRLPRGENKHDNQSATVALTISPDNPECSPMIEFPSYSARLIVDDTKKNTNHASSMGDIR